MIGEVVTNHFSGPGRAIRPLYVCVCVAGQQLMNEMTFDLYVWLADIHRDTNMGQVPRSV